MTSSTKIHHELASYLKSAPFLSRAQSVQREYTRVAGHLKAMVGYDSISDVDRAWVRRRRDEWAVDGHRAATIRLQVLKNALEPLISDGVISSAVFHKQQRVQRPHGTPEQNVVWTDDEFEYVLGVCLSASPGLARAIALARYAGLRRQDICKATHACRYTVPLRGGHTQHRIRLTVEKGEVALDIREDPRLTDILDNQTCGSAMDIEEIAYNMYGDPWKARQLNQALDRTVARLEQYGLIRRNLTLHGLRHTRGVELAHAGASDAELMAQLGHTDEQSARVYRRQAMKMKLADSAQRLVDQRRLQQARRK